MAIIKISDLCITLQNRKILEGLSLDINTGILAILGPNGVGKTSLLRAIIGDIKPAPGSIFLGGQDLSGMKNREIAQIITIVPQEHNPVFSYSVEDIVLMGRGPYIKPLGVPSESDRAIANDAIEKIGISHLRKRIYTELSGGERKLVLIAMAICQETEIILLDEPTVFLDLYNAHRILDLVKRFSIDEKKTIILVLHDVNYALLCTDKALLIYDSTNFLEGNPREIINAKNLSKLYNIQFEPGKTESNNKFIMPLIR